MIPAAESRALRACKKRAIGLVISPPRATPASAGVDGTGRNRLGYAFLLLALAVLAVVAAPIQLAQAEQGFSRSRTLFAGRMDVGEDHSCAIAADGTLRCWGWGANGRLGYGNTNNIGDNELPSSVPPVYLGNGRTAVQVAAGANHTCALLDDGSLRCWGQNTYGQLGSGNTIQVGDDETPGSVATVQVGTNRTVRQVVTGTSLTCVLLDNGTVKCWGVDGAGQLGYATNANLGDDEKPSSYGAIDLGAGRTAVSIAAGANFVCALLDNGTVRCWGSNTNGQLGLGSAYGNVGDNETPGSVPTLEFGAGRTAVALTAGSIQACAILDNGTVKCWGGGANGKLGYGNISTVYTPSSVGAVELGAGRTAVSLSAGDFHTCALLDNGTVKCWGANSYGQLGYGNTTQIGDDETPAAVSPVDLGTGRLAVAVSAGENHTCALLDNGTVRCWGNAGFGQVGYGNTANVGDNETPGSLPPVSLGSAHGSLEVAAGASHSCALLGDNNVYCWGSGANGRLGYANTTNIGDNETPASAGPVDLGGRGAVEIAAGEAHTCALMANGSVYCWGNGASGRLGYANTASIGDNETPAAAGPVELGGAAIEITAGNQHTCALLTNGTVRCWGVASFGRLGYGNTNTIGDTETPASVAPVEVGRSTVALSAGGFHTCADLDDGSMRCWGWAGNGALGYANTNNIGDTETPASAGAVSIGGNAKGVATGTEHSCVLLTNSTVRCWGLAAYGQIGQGNTTNIGDNELPSTVPVVQVGWQSDMNVEGTAAVAAAGHTTCALLVRNEMKCWGLNEFGQLGYGNTSNIGDKETPLGFGAIDTGGSVQSMAVGTSHTCADLTDGNVRCWGLNTSGQLGNANTVNVGDNETPTSYGPADLYDDPPVAAADAITATEDTPIAIEVLANDSDIDGGPKVVESKTNGSHGTITITGGGTGVTYAPEANYCGPDSSTYTLNGGSTATVSVTVTCVDDAPVAVNDSATVVEDSAGTAIDVLSNDTDVDGGPKAIASKTNGAHGIVTTTGGGTGVVYTPAANYCGPDSFTYELNGSSMTTVSLTITCVDDPPVAVKDSATITEDAPAAAIDVLANDTDIDGGPKSIAFQSHGAHGTVAITGEGTGLTYAPAANYCGPDSFTYTLNGGSTAAVSVTVTCVDDPPVAVKDSVTIAEDASATAMEALANDTDIDGGPEEVVSKTSAAHGTVAIKAGGSDVTYAPAANYCGPDSFTYTLNGGSTATVSVTVTCVDDPPVAVNDSTSVTEDSPAQVIDVLANDTDVDGGPELIASKSAAAHGTVATIGGGAGLTYAPAANYCGPDSFTYEVNGGSTATVSVTVTCVDDPPAAVKDSATVTEDAQPTAIDVLANDTDVDGGPKTIASKTNAPHGTVSIKGEGSEVTYSPDANFCGEDSFSYTLNGGSTTSVSISVSCVDDPPVAVKDAVTIAEDAGATALEVLANDTDVDAGPKAITAKTDGAHGAVAFEGEGTDVTYTPAANYCGPDSFTYTLNGGSTATVSVTVTCVDDAPVAVDDTVSIAEDSGAQTVDVLGNDTDIDGGLREIASKTNGTHGGVTVIAGRTAVSYAPDPNYCGPDSFTYTLNGGSTATVSVTLTCVDDPPVAVKDSATVTEDGQPAAIDVLANDTDIDGGPKTIASKTNAPHGTVSIKGEGSEITYSPDANFCGEDSFTYTLNGGSTATVSVTVTCVDDPPVAVKDSVTIAEDASATAMEALANDTDIDGGPQEVVSKTSAAHGTVAIKAGGSDVTYAPAANYCGSDSFTYTLNGGSTATVSVSVGCVDDVPVAIDDSKTVQEASGTTEVSVLANDTDIDGGPKLVESKTNGANGEVAITSGGEGVTYAPDANFCGEDSFTYTLNGGSTATVFVMVVCVDSPPVAVADSLSLPEDASPTSVNVLGNDTDSDGGPKEVTLKTNGAHGTVAIATGGSSVTYTPDPNYCGPDSFTYTLNGGSSSTVSVTVTCVDDSPVAVGDSRTLEEDAGMTAVEVLANDTDIDGGVKEVTSRTNGSHGTVAIAGEGSGVVYTPNANYCGSDSFTYTLNGGSQAAVSITVACVDDLPVAADDGETVLQGSSAQAIDVLANDTDIDGGPKSVIGKTNGSHGIVALLGGGAGLTYTPEANYCGSDAFTYTLNGGSRATVSVTVTCVTPAAPPESPGAQPPSTTTSTATTTTTSASTGPVVNVTPGVGVISGRRRPRIAVKGSYAFFTLTCTSREGDCAGTVTITATVPAVSLGATMRKVVLVQGKFRIGAGRSVLVRARITGHGLEALESKQTLRGVATEMVIRDTGNHERGSIQVNLVRRPKASFLPPGTRKK